MIVKDRRQFTRYTKRRSRRPNLLYAIVLIAQIVLGGMIGILLATVIIGELMPDNPVYLTIKQFLTRLFVG